MTDKIIIANWKMNPATIKEATSLFGAYIKIAEQYPAVEIVVCPPVIYIEELSKFLRDHPVASLCLGAQDASWNDDGAFTGEISVRQLIEFNVKYVLVGHSERRATGETDEIVSNKLSAVVRHGIKSILLIGEQERGETRRNTLIEQLSRDLAGFPFNHLDKLLVVYEPVWAISSNSGGVGDTPENAAEATEIIRQILEKIFGAASAGIPILYGGSVNSGNAAGFLANDKINGLVIGAASLQIDNLEPIFQSPVF